MSDDRLTDLEVKVAFQEHTIQQLDEVIQTLQTKVEALERQLAEVVEEQKNAMPPLENPPPPHW